MSQVTERGRLCRRAIRRRPIAGISSAAASRSAPQFRWSIWIDGVSREGITAAGRQNCYPVGRTLITKSPKLSLRALCIQRDYVGNIQIVSTMNYHGEEPLTGLRTVMVSNQVPRSCISLLVPTPEGSVGNHRDTDRKTVLVRTLVREL